MCVPCLKAYVEIQPRWDGTGRWDLWGWLCHEDGETSWMGLAPFKGASVRVPLLSPLSRCFSQSWEDIARIYNPGLAMPVPWSLTSQPPELWEIKFGCKPYPVYSSFNMAAQWVKIICKEAQKVLVYPLPTGPNVNILHNHGTVVTTKRLANLGTRLFTKLQA